MTISSAYEVVQGKKMPTFVGCAILYVFIRAQLIPVRLL